MNYTTQQWMDRWDDQREIKNLMGKYAHCLILNWERRIFNMLWAQDADSVSLGFNHGRYEGAGAIKAYYQAVHDRSGLIASILQEKFPRQLGSKAEEEIHGVGVLRIRPLYCPVIEISQDGDSAKGLWCCQGAHADVYKYGPSSSWTFGYYIAEFVKQNSEWRILKLHCVDDIDSRCGFSWGKPVPQLQNLPGFEALSDSKIPEPNNKRPLREHYSPTRPFTGAPAIPDAWCAGAKVDDPELQRVIDIEAIKNIMYYRSYYIANDDRAGELRDLWVTGKDRKETASFGRNWGWYVGLDSIRSYYVDAHDKSLEDLKKATGASGVNQGCVYSHPATTGIVELAADGATAKGMWYAIAQETAVKIDGTADARWYLEKIAVDFVKEGDDWKIWHLVIASDLNCEAGEDYSRQPVYVDWEKDPVKREFGTPDIKQLIHDSTFNWWDDSPPPPEPYESFSDELSYGPEGWKNPKIRHLRAKEGGRYK